MNEKLNHRRERENLVRASLQQQSANAYWVRRQCRRSYSSRNRIAPHKDPDKTIYADIPRDRLTDRLTKSDESKYNLTGKHYYCQMLQILYTNVCTKYQKMVAFHF